MSARLFPSMISFSFRLVHFPLHVLVKLQTVSLLTNLKLFLSPYLCLFSSLWKKNNDQCVLFIFIYLK